MDLPAVFKALSDPLRLDILQKLNNSSLTVGQIVENYNLPNSTISYHLSVLKKANLITQIKNKNFINYQINIDTFEDAVTWMNQFFVSKNKK